MTSSYDGTGLIPKHKKEYFSSEKTRITTPTSVKCTTDGIECKVVISGDFITPNSFKDVNIKSHILQDSPGRSEDIPKGKVIRREPCP